MVVVWLLFFLGGVEVGRGVCVLGERECVCCVSSTTESKDPPFSPIKYIHLYPPIHPPTHPHIYIYITCIFTNKQVPMNGASVSYTGPVPSSYTWNINDDRVTLRLTKVRMETWELVGRCLFSFVSEAGKGGDVY